MNNIACNVKTLIVYFYFYAYVSSAWKYNYNLPDIMLVATKVLVISRRFVVFTWMRDDKELV